MKVFVATEFRIKEFSGNYYAFEKHSNILKRYYKSFGKLSLCTRVEKVSKKPDNVENITEILSEVINITSLYRCMLGLDNKKISNAMMNSELAICRCHSIVAYRAADIARKLHIPYLAECMGDAWDAYWNHSVIGKCIAPYMYLKMKSVVKHSNYALYVTNSFLQNKYPCICKNIAASNVLIESLDESIIQKRIDKIINKFSKDNYIKLMTTAAVDVRYKGQQYVIKAMPRLNKLGIKIEYYIVGEGDNTYLKNLAKKERVLDQVKFMGRMPLKQVIEYLDDIDIYIQPSLQEGLPRSVIEAMSRGCIAIGANTAGIPELLDSRYVIRRKSVDDIVRLVVNICNMDKKQFITISNRNFEEAKKYQRKVLDSRREAFFEQIKLELRKESK